MPELPEVETIVNELKKDLVGLKIKGLWTDWLRIVRHGTLKDLKSRVIGRKIVAVERRAKYIILDLQGPDSLFIHQKISGHLLYGKWKFASGKWISQIKGALRDDPQNRFIRLVLPLSNGHQLALADQRRFGKIMVASDDQINNIPDIKKLGPEPLELSLKDFQSLFNKKRGKLKVVLLDPFFIAGIGNIYSDEILWGAGLHPLSKVENLDHDDLKKLYKFTQGVLKRAIKYRGTSSSDYRLPSGVKGNFQTITRAYQRTGEKCQKEDGGIITRLKIGGRSAHFCPKHQILK